MICLAALAMAATAVPATTSFCRDYQAVVDQAFRGFRKYRGVIETDNDLGFDKTFEATLSMPGARCQVNETETDYSYVCTWKHGSADDWSGAVAEARNLGKALANCSRLAFVDAGEGPTSRGQQWSGFVGFKYDTRIRVEVGAQRWETRSRLLPPQQLIITMRVRYRRETRS